MIRLATTIRFACSNSKYFLDSKFKSTLNSIQTPQQSLLIHREPFPNCVIHSQTIMWVSATFAHTAWAKNLQKRKNTDYKSPMRHNTISTFKEPRHSCKNKEFQFKKPRRLRFHGFLEQCRMSIKLAVSCSKLTRAKSIPNSKMYNIASEGTT
jgi:hypothetical protein